MTTQIQVKYKPDYLLNAEVELFRFQSEESAEKFLASILKHPDVVDAKKI